MTDSNPRGSTATGQAGPGGGLRVITSNRVLGRNVGGNSTYARKIVSGLTNAGVDITVWGPAPSSNRYFRAARNVLAETASIERAAKSGNAELIYFPADTGPIARTAIPKVVTIHGLAAAHVRGIRSPTQELIWTSRVKRAASVAEHVITVSKTSADDLVRYLKLDASKVTCIPHGIDHVRFNTDPVDLSSGIAELPERFALFVGNIEPRKNVDSLLKAFESVELKRADLKLVVAGKPAWGAKNTLAALRSNSAVRYLNWVSDSDLVALLQRAEMFVFPSLYEGFGFPPLEAMASGCPVICSNRGSLGDIAGAAAITVPDPSPAALAREINRVHRSAALRDEMRAAGLSWALNFKWEKSVGAHKELFESIARQGKA